jgi:hypothetical protein
MRRERQVQEDLIREIAVEISELKDEFDSRINTLHRKLKIALGDTIPAAKVTEFVCRDGKTRPIRNGGRK